MQPPMTAEARAAQGKGLAQRLVGAAFVIVLAWLCAFSAAWAQAAGEDDYRAGRQAYQAGDVVGAMRSLRTAADAGHAKAQGLLAVILDRSGSPEEALRYYERAAAQGDAESETALALTYALRGGRDADARVLLNKAAARDYAPAIEALAEAYLKQTLGLTAAARDNTEAVAALRRAAERDYLPAVAGLAAAYRDGQFGLAADAAESARWAARAEQLRKQRAAVGRRAGTEKK